MAATTTGGGARRVGRADDLLLDNVGVMQASNDGPFRYQVSAKAWHLPSAREPSFRRRGKKPRQSRPWSAGEGPIAGQAAAGGPRAFHRASESRRGTPEAADAPRDRNAARGNGSGCPRAPLYGELLWRARGLVTSGTIDGWGSGRSKLKCNNSN